MKIAFNPSTMAALITPPNNKDITFDLRGRNIFARGVKFCGTDTWRDIKINNVSIGSNILDLRNGSNTTLTNTNGVVTINSTQRPVVDNLTSDSTTSSLSANQGRILKALIDGKSNSDHNHDGRYLKLTGGTMTGNIAFSNSSYLLWNNGSYHQRIFLTDDSTADTAVFTFQQSSDSGVNWNNLMTIRDNGKVIANTFVGALQGNASTATKLTSSAGNVALPIYFSDGKPVACTASSIFSNLSNSGNNLSITVAGQNRKLTVGYANNTDTVDGYHANTVYNAPSFTVNNGNTSNTYILLATITISGTSLSYSEFTILFQNRECLDNSSFILSGAIRRNSTTNVGATLSYITLHTEIPRNIYLRSNDGVTFMVYIQSAASAWTTYYRAIPIVDSRNIIYSNTGTTSPISGSVLNITATKGGNVNYASSAGNADTLDSYHANGLLTALSNSNKGISITVGGTTKSISNISVNYANSSGYTNYLNSVSRMDYGWNGINYFNASLTAGCAAKVNDSPTSTWWHILRFNHGNNSGYYTDLAIPFNNNSLYWKTIRGGSLVYSSWVKILDSLNYNEYAPTKTGGGASGTWGISITGNANTVDGQHFNWNNNKNDHTYLWAATDNGNAYLVHRASISVNYANSAGSASSATKVIVNQHTANDTNYPLVWSNQNNTNNVTENQLYKSWLDLYYNPKHKRLTIGGSIYAAHFYESSDKVLKKNIKSILSSTNIPKIREFDWKDTGEHSYGFIAQELEEQGYSYLVSEANGKKTVNYTATLALTVAKLQNLINIQNKKISNLTKELKALKYGRKKNS